MCLSLFYLLFAVNNKRRWKKGGGTRKVIHNFFVFPSQQEVDLQSDFRQTLFVCICVFFFVLCFADDDVVMFDQLPLYFIVSNMLNKMTS